MKKQYMRKCTPAQIRKLRKKLGITQGELAERCGVTWVTVNRWENGKSKPQHRYQMALRKLDRPTEVKDRVFEAEKVIISSILYRWEKERGVAYAIAVVDGDDVFARMRTPESCWQDMHAATKELLQEIETQKGDVRHDIKKG